MAATDAPSVDDYWSRVNYQPRPQFLRFHARSERFACIVTHRRAGKTVACIHDLHRDAQRCAKERPRFAYLSPFFRQSKAVAWDYLRALADPLRDAGARSHETELRIDYPDGGQVRLYGADNPDALRGIYLDGVVLDEYADMDPRVWSEIIRPALADRAGWAVFIGTPRGRNNFFAMWRRAQAEPGWFALMLKASETGSSRKASLSWRGAISPRSSTRRNSNARSRRRSSAPITGSRWRRPRRPVASPACPTIPRRWCGPRGISASAMPPRSGSRR